MNYAQLINLFNGYLADSTARSFTTYIQRHRNDASNGDATLNLDSLVSGNVNAGSNAKYNELLNYIAEHNIDISGDAAKEDLRLLYNKVITNKIALKVSDSVVDYLYGSAKPIGTKRNGDFKLSKTGRAKYWLFSVGVKKFLIPVLTITAATAGVVGLIAALTPIGGSAFATGSALVNFITGITIGAPFGFAAAVGIMAAKDLITKAYYKHQIKKGKLAELVKKIETTQEKISAKKGFFSRIANYFRSGVNRNRLWAVAKYREKISDKYDKISDEQTRAQYADDIAMVDKFMYKHMRNCYSESLITGRAMRDMDIIGKYYTYDLQNDSKALKLDLAKRNTRHPGRTKAAEVQATAKNVAAKFVRDALTGRANDIFDTLTPAEQIGQPSKAAVKLEELKQTVAQNKKERQQAIAEETEQRKQAREAKKAYKQSDEYKQKLEDEQTAKQNKKKAQTALKLARVAETQEDVNAVKQTAEDVKNTIASLNDSKSEQAKKIAADTQPIIDEAVKEVENNEKVINKIKNTPVTKPEPAKKEQPAKKEDDKKPETDKKAEPKKTVPAKKASTSSRSIPKNITSYELKDISVVKIDDSSIINRQRRVIAKVKVTFEQTNSDGTTTTKTATKNLEIAKGKAKQMEVIANTPTERDSAIRQKLGMSLTGVAASSLEAATTKDDAPKTTTTAPSAKAKANPQNRSFSLVNPQGKTTKGDAQEEIFNDMNNGLKR